MSTKKKDEIRVKTTLSKFSRFFIYISIILSITAIIWITVEDAIHGTGNTDLGKGTWDYKHPFWYIFLSSLALCFITFFWNFIAFFKNKKTFYQNNSVHLKLLSGYLTIIEILWTFLAIMFNFNGWFWWTIILYGCIGLILLGILYINKYSNRMERDVLNSILLTLEKNDEKNKDDYEKIYDMLNDIKRLKKVGKKLVPKIEKAIAKEDTTVVEPKKVEEKIDTSSKPVEQPSVTNQDNSKK